MQLNAPDLTATREVVRKLIDQARETHETIQAAKETMAAIGVNVPGMAEALQQAEFSAEEAKAAAIEARYWISMAIAASIAPNPGR